MTECKALIVELFMLYECVSGELIWGTDETLVHLEKVLDIYRNGHYLKNNTERHKTGE